MYHPDKFSGYGHCDSEDITYLIFHVILQDYLFKGLCHFMGGRFS